ncbi:MAG: hypothetical protein M4579_001721 [Chaenotheca gracillima]|nr:MAG: hypothetical protein M4579_001721 [Chaenotheca gracillima]
MGGNASAGSSSSAVLTVQRALDIVRENDDGPATAQAWQVLEQEFGAIWQRLFASPTTYIFTRDEFAVFNLYRIRFNDNPTAIAAISRYWHNTQGAQGNVNGL